MLLDIYMKLFSFIYIVKNRKTLPFNYELIITNYESGRWSVN